jgi:hypothetical protein
MVYHKNIKKFQEHEVTLDYAGNMLMPDCVDSMGNPFAAMHQPTNPKSKSLIIRSPH